MQAFFSQIRLSRKKRRIATAYLAQDAHFFAERVPYELQLCFQEHWRGNVGLAFDLSCSLDLESLPEEYQPIVIADRSLLAMKLGHALTQELPSQITKCHFARLIYYYSRYTTLFWQDHRQANRLWWPMILLALRIRFMTFVMTCLFLRFHLQIMAGKQSRIHLASIFYRILRNLDRWHRVPRISKGVVFSSIPYSFFMAGRLKEIGKLLSEVESIVPHDPYYLANLNISSFYIAAYTGDIARTETLSAKFQKMHREGKNRRYFQLARILPLLPLAIRGYGRIIRGEFEAILAEHRSEESDPVVNAQFYRISAVIALILHDKIRAKELIAKAQQFRSLTNSFYLWKVVDHRITTYIQQNGPFNPLRDKILDVPVDMSPSTHLANFLIEIFNVIPAAINNEQDVFDEIAALVSSHLHVGEFKVQGDFEVTGKEVAIRFLDKYIVCSQIEPERRQFALDMISVIIPALKIIEDIYRQVAHANQLSLEKAQFMNFSQMAQSIGHDLRAPLSTIERLLLLPPQALLQDHKVYIQESLSRLNSMVEALHHADLEMIIRPRLQPVSFAAGIKIAEGRALARHITLEYPPAASLVLRVDLIKFERAWMNLILNAIDFASSKVSLEFRLEGAFFFLRVIDDGPGVAPEIRESLFQRGATFGKSGGTGLGLAYARQIMQGHGGDVGYRREGGLSIFECYLPSDNALSPGNPLEKPSSNASKASHPPQTIAVCLFPSELSLSVLEKLRDYESSALCFVNEITAAHVVITNIDSLIFQAMEADKELVHIGESLNELEIIERVVRKFDLARPGLAHA